MSYNLFLDDERNPPGSSFVVARNTRDAMAIVKMRGLPAFMSLDHDLGCDDTGREDNGMIFVKLLQNMYPYGPVPGYVVHSANLPGKKNIAGFLESWRRFCRMPRREWKLPFGALLEMHHKYCACSYCDGPKMRGIGLSLPVDKRRNSWRVIHVKFNGRSKLYLRWTLSKWLNKIINPKDSK
jgi:hypothetical protein